MANDFKKASRGDPFRPNAAMYNATIDLIEQFRGGPPASPIIGLEDFAPNIVWLRNDTGSTKIKHSILGIGAAILSNSGDAVGFKQKPVFKGETPTTASHWNKPAVLLADLPEDMVGPALVAGAIPVQCNIDNVNHRWADVNDSETASLKSYATGSVKILSTPTSTGVQWVYADLGRIFKGTLLGKADSSISAGNSGTVSIYKGSDRSDTTYSVTAYAIVAVSSAKWLSVEEIDGTYYAFKIEC